MSPKHFLKNKRLVIPVCSCLTDYFTSPGLSFFTCKMRIIIIVPTHRLVVKTNAMYQQPSGT